MVYRWVYGRDLTTEELRTSRLPDNSLNSVEVTFVSKGHKRYTAIHTRRSLTNQPTLQYVILRCPDKDREDFEHVKRVVERETRGKAEGQITVTDSDICDVINIPWALTQATVAGFVDRYRDCFSEVRILRAGFSNVARTNYENSGLPAEKLTAEYFISG